MAGKGEGEVVAAAVSAERIVYRNNEIGLTSIRNALKADVLEPVRATTETDPKILSNDAATLSEVSMASLLGACSGYAAKKLAKTTGLIVGVSFIGVQVLVKADILKVNWPRVETLLIGQVDQDGDGKLTHQDLKLATGRMLHNLTTDMPSSAGFAAAFALGFRYG